MYDLTFSVIIPAYNAEKTLRSTVSSVLAQSEQDFEVIVVDDGSTDNTLQVMLDLAALDQRVRALSIANSGVSAARNCGANLARGEWLAFLDADDQWHPEKLAAHLALHQAQRQLVGSFAQIEFAPEHEGQLSTGRTFSTVPRHELQIEDVLVENAVCTTSNLILYREAFRASGGFDERMRYAEDQELLARVIDRGGMIRGINKPLVRYRMSEDGLSCDFEAMLANWRSFAAGWIEGGDLARAEATYLRYLTRRALRAGANSGTARSLAWRGLCADRANFMTGGFRSLLTLAGVFAGSVMPAFLRRAVFA